MSACGGQMVGDLDGSVEAGSAAEASDEGSSSHRTCGDVGKTPTIDSCCLGSFCAGKCYPTYNPPCVCDQGSSLAPCTSESAYCCPGLGCASLQTCLTYLHLMDAGAD